MPLCYLRQRHGFFHCGGGSFLHFCVASVVSSFPVIVGSTLKYPYLPPSLSVRARPARLSADTLMRVRVRVRLSAHTLMRLRLSAHTLMQSRVRVCG